MGELNPATHEKYIHYQVEFILGIQSMLNVRKGINVLH